MYDTIAIYDYIYANNRLIVIRDIGATYDY